MPPPLTSKEGRFLEYLKGSPVPDDADSSNSTRERVQQEERELGELLIKRKQEGTSISDADAARAEQLLGQWSSRQKMAQSRKRKRDREAREQDGIVARMEQGTGAEVFELDWDALAEMEACGMRSVEGLESITLVSSPWTTSLQGDGSQSSTSPSSEQENSQSRSSSGSQNSQSSSHCAAFATVMGAINILNLVSLECRQRREWMAAQVGPEDEQRATQSTAATAWEASPGTQVLEFPPRSCSWTARRQGAFMARGTARS